jgi:hypothetical protein
MVLKVSALLWLSAAALAQFQGVPYNDVAINQLGRPINAATIRVCTEGASGTPCSPTVTVYNDRALTSAKASPFTSDAYGNFSFYARPGIYQVQVSYGSSYTTSTVSLPSVADSSRRWARVSTTGASSVNVFGDGATGTGNCPNGPVAATATEPSYQNCAQAAATINTNAGLQGSSGMWRVGRNLEFSLAGKVRETANVRVFFCLTDQTLATMLASDNPAGNYACFRWSTGAADATIKFITKDNTTQNVQAATGYADTSTHHVYRILEDVGAALWRFYIDGVQVGTASANLPTAGTNLRYIAGQQNLTATVMNFDFAWIEIRADQ